MASSRYSTNNNTTSRHATKKVKDRVYLVKMASRNSFAWRFVVIVTSIDGRRKVDVVYCLCIAIVTIHLQPWPHFNRSYWFEICLARHAARADRESSVIRRRADLDWPHFFPSLRIRNRWNENSTRRKNWYIFKDYIERLCWVDQYESLMDNEKEGSKLILIFDNCDIASVKAMETSLRIWTILSCLTFTRPQTGRGWCLTKHLLSYHRTTDGQSNIQRLSVVLSYHAIHRLDDRWRASSYASNDNR